MELQRQLQKRMEILSMLEQAREKFIRKRRLLQTTINTLRTVQQQLELRRDDGAVMESEGQDAIQISTRESKQKKADDVKKRLDKLIKLQGRFNTLDQKIEEVRRNVDELKSRIQSSKNK